MTTCNSSAACMQVHFEVAIRKQTAEVNDRDTNCFIRSSSWADASLELVIVEVIVN